MPPFCRPLIAPSIVAGRHGTPAAASLAALAYQPRSQDCALARHGKRAAVGARIPLSSRRVAPPHRNRAEALHAGLRMHREAQRRRQH